MDKQPTPVPRAVHVHHNGDDRAPLFPDTDLINTHADDILSVTFEETDDVIFHFHTATPNKKLTIYFPRTQGIKLGDIFNLETIDAIDCTLLEKARQFLINEVNQQLVFDLLRKARVNEAR